MTDARRAAIRAIEVTGDPLAPFKMREAHAAAGAVGKMLALVTTPDAVRRVNERLLDGFSDAELDVADFALVVALAANLREALERVGRHLMEDPSVRPRPGG